MGLYVIDVALNERDIDERGVERRRGIEKEEKTSEHLKLQGISHACINSLARGDLCEHGKPTGMNGTCERRGEHATQVVRDPVSRGKNLGERYAITRGKHIRLGGNKRT